MDVRIGQARLSGTVPAVASKSVAHRMLICAALCDGPTEIACNTTSADIAATVRCLASLGASITPEDGHGFSVRPRSDEPGHPVATLDCGESGSTLRFLLPVVCALGCGGSLVGHGRLAERPLSPLYEQLLEHGCSLSPQGAFPLEVSGKLSGGTFVLPGDVSSQYVTGLLLTAPLLDEPTEILVAEPVQSAPYIALTIGALESFGIDVNVSRTERERLPHLRYRVDPAQGRLSSPGSCTVEGDWSNAAFWLAADALGSDIAVSGLEETSAQGDRAILSVLESFGATTAKAGGKMVVNAESLHGADIDVADIPDLVPPLAAVAAAASGTTHLTNAGRLRLKESDRLATVTASLRAFGVDARVIGDDIHIVGGASLHGATVDAANDHRIAMLASILATRAAGTTTVLGADCVGKSYPAFYQDFSALGGDVRPAADGSV